MRKYTYHEEKEEQIMQEKKAAVVFAAAGFAQRGILADQNRRRTVFFFGGHGKAGRTGNLHKGIKAHQIAQDQVHIHGTGHVAAVDAAGIRPGAAGGADALGQGVHLAHPARQVAARELVGQTHGGLIGVARHHGVKGFPVGNGLARAPVGIVGVVVRVILQGQLTVGPFYFVIFGAAAYAQHFVVLELHRSSGHCAACAPVLQVVPTRGGSPGEAAARTICPQKAIPLRRPRYGRAGGCKDCRHQAEPFRRQFRAGRLRPLCCGILPAVHSLRGTGAHA